MSKLNADVIIVGGGLAGATLAAILGNSGIACIIIEAGSRIDQSKAYAADPRALALTHASRHIFDSINVWSHLPKDRIAYFDGMYVWDENGKGNVEFDSADLCQPVLGHIVEQSVLQGTLELVIDSIPAIKVYHNAGLTDIGWQQDHVSVTLNNGEKLTAQLVVGADGVKSTCRELAGINYKVHDYQQTAIACVVNTALPHDNIARQRFLTHGPLAFLPMTDNKQCAIVWSTTHEQAEELLKMTATKFNVFLQESFQHTLGEILASEPRASFPLSRAEAEHYCRERFTLVGDAAHSIHPLAGQGANLGLLDAASLAQLIVKAKTANKNIAGRRVLRTYERWRRGENKVMMMTMESFKYAFENQTAPVPMLRNSALNIANSFIPLKHTIMRHAMGLAGDLPEMAKGHSV
jgi:2-polyprenylphenol 6-hydroxylase